MKTYVLILIHIASALVLLNFACSKQQSNAKLQGTWKSKDGATVLKINSKHFVMQDGEAPVTEDYFLKGDTILTSFEGNQPYTKFVIQKLDDKRMKLLFPDSVSIEFNK